MRDIERATHKGRPTAVITVRTKGTLRTLLIGDKGFDDRTAAIIDEMGERGYRLANMTGVGYVRTLVFEKG